MNDKNIMTVNIFKTLVQPTYKDSDAAHAAVVALVLAYMDTKPVAMQDGDEQLIVPPFLPALEYLAAIDKNNLEEAYTRVSRSCHDWQELNKHLHAILDPVLTYMHWESRSIAQLQKLCAALCKSREEMDAATYGQFIQESILSLSDAYLGTPESLCAIIESLVMSYGRQQGGNRVYDPFCLSGNLLVPFGREGGMEVCGEEVNVYNAALARLKMRILGYNEDVIHLSDAIARPTFTSKGHLTQFDFVVSHLPFGIIRDDWQLGEDVYKRFVAGKPVRNSAEWPFLAHMLAQADERKGVVVAIVSTGTLFRSGVARDYREHLTNGNMLEAVVLLPAGTLIGTTVAPVLLVLRKGRKGRMVRFVNAGLMGTKPRNISYLKRDEVKRICELILSEKEEPGEARSVTLDEIVKHGYSWQVSNYVTRTALPQEKVDPAQLAKDIHRLRSTIADKQARLDVLLADWNKK